MSVNTDIALIRDALPRCTVWWQIDEGCGECASCETRAACDRVEAQVTRLQDALREIARSDERPVVSVSNLRGVARAALAKEAT